MTNANIIAQTNIDRLSVNSQGNEGNNFSINPSTSGESAILRLQTLSKSVNSALSGIGGDRYWDYKEHKLLLLAFCPHFPPR